MAEQSIVLSFKNTIDYNWEQMKIIFEFKIILLIITCTFIIFIIINDNTNNIFHITDMYVWLNGKYLNNNMHFCTKIWDVIKNFSTMGKSAA